MTRSTDSLSTPAAWQWHHACPLSYGAIASYMSANKELGHDANDTGRSVA